MAAPLDGSVALLTGASRGIGAACAIALARLGARVVLCARTQGGLEEIDDTLRAEGREATLIPLDLTEGEAVDKLGPSLFQRFGRLDILVHAAGTLGRLTPAPHIQNKDFADAAGVHIDATWRLIRSCGPLLQAAPAGRAVFLADARARAPKGYWGIYAATKAAEETLALCWADENRSGRLRINLFDPGPVATRLRRQAFPGEDIADLRRPEDVAPAIAALCLPGETRHGERVAMPA